MRLLQPALARAAELRKQLCPARFVFAIGKQADGAAVRRAPHRRQRTARLPAVLAGTTPASANRPAASIT
ncbi:hypothetical protein G6F32_016551 [Rhizopus arrhizus]|nr:hypothetical protein G6F32_016551 [Rhizopus arrhizus]